MLKFGIIDSESVAYDALAKNLYNSFNLTKIEKIDPKRQSLKNLEKKLDVLVLPGVTGDNCSYWNDLVTKKNDLFMSTQNGLSLLCICAGSNIIYEETLFNYFEKGPIISKGLGFIKGLTEGPVDKHNAPKYIETTSRLQHIRPIKISFNHSSGKQFEALVCYGDGPAFFPKENVLALARYQDLENQPLAITAKKIGHGLVIMTGVLFDIGIHNMHAREEYQTEVEKLKQCMLPHENSRRIIMHDIYMRLIDNKIRQRNLLVS